jgi:alkylhydroperoxidase family enzyme
VKSGSGTVANILRVHGIEPDVGRAHLALYKTIMFGVSKVTRLEREAIAVAVSAANKCHY